MKKPAPFICHPEERSGSHGTFLRAVGFPLNENAPTACPERSPGKRGTCASFGIRNPEFRFLNLEIDWEFGILDLGIDSEFGILNSRIRLCP